MYRSRHILPGSGLKSFISRPLPGEKQRKEPYACMQLTPLTRGRGMSTRMTQQLTDKIGPIVLPHSYTQSWVKSLKYRIKSMALGIFVLLGSLLITSPQAHVARMNEQIIIFS